MFARIFELGVTAVLVGKFELGVTAVLVGKFELDVTDVVIFLALLVTVTNCDSRPYNNVIDIAKGDTLQNELSQRVSDAVVTIWSDGCLDAVTNSSVHVD